MLRLRESDKYPFQRFINVGTVMGHGSRWRFRAKKTNHNHQPQFDTSQVGIAHMYGGFGLSALFLVFLIPFAVRFIRWWRAEDKAALEPQTRGTLLVSINSSRQ